MPLELSLSRAAILRKCIHIVETFDPKKTTVDAYAEDCQALKDKNLGEIESKFVKQVFYGCTRYQKFLKVFVTSFLYKCPTQAVRSEQTVYMVLAYLLFFRLEELGVDEFRLFLASGVSNEISLLAMLQFAFNIEELEKWVKVEWCKIYDIRYIEEDIIMKLQRQAEHMRPTLEEIEFKATGTITTSDGSTIQLREKKKLVSPRPFNLTQPKPRLIPEPEVISREVKALPIPATIHATSLEVIEKEKAQRRAEEKARCEAKYPANKALESDCRRDGSELEELAKKIEAARMAECTFQPVTKRYVPPTEEAVVRQNVASVLREDALLKQKQAKECELFKRYEQELHDPSEFYRWQEEMKAKDNLAEQQQVMQRMVEMQLARDSAMEAIADDKRKKAISAEELKEELKIQRAVMVQENEAELLKKQELCQDVYAERDNTRFAEQAAAKSRGDRAEQIRKDKEAEFERKRREDEVELERRKDIIRQIRALEKVPVERFKPFDKSEQPCQGLLDEMSYLELQERLAVVKARTHKEVEEKKERQIEKKLEKQQEIMEKADNLARIRERSKVNAVQRQEDAKKKQQEEKEREKLMRERAVEEVAARIQQKKQQKREEEQKLRKENVEKALQRQFEAAGASGREVKIHQEQHRGLEREARDRQNKALLTQHKSNSAKAQEFAMRKDNQLKQAGEMAQQKKAMQGRIDKALEEDRQLKDDIVQMHMNAVALQRNQVAKVRAEFGHSMSKYSGGPRSVRPSSLPPPRATRSA